MLVVASHRALSTKGNYGQFNAILHKLLQHMNNILITTQFCSYQHLDFIIIRLHKIWLCLDTLNQCLTAGIKKKWLADLVGQSNKLTIEIPRQSLGHTARCCYHSSLAQQFLILCYKNFLFLSCHSRTWLQNLCLCSTFRYDSQAGTGFPSHLHKILLYAIVLQLFADKLTAFAPQITGGNAILTKNSGYIGYVNTLATGSIIYLSSPHNLTLD